MAYTVPKTWTSGETLTSNDLNIYIRDNIRYLAEQKAIYQTENILPGGYVAYWIPQLNSTTVTTVGGAWTSTGTTAAVLPAATIEYTTKPRITFTTGTTPGTAAGIRLTNSNLFLNGFDSFRYRFQFGLTTNNSTLKRGFFGVKAAAANQPNTAFTSTTAYPNIFGIGFDAGDTTLKVYTNDGTASQAPTIEDTGYAINTINTQWFYCELVCTGGFFTIKVYDSSALSVIYEGSGLSAGPDTSTTALSCITQVVSTGATNIGLHLGAQYIELSDNSKFGALYI